MNLFNKIYDEIINEVFAAYFKTEDFYAKEDEPKELHVSPNNAELVQMSYINHRGHRSVRGMVCHGKLFIWNPRDLSHANAFRISELSHCADEDGATIYLIIDDKGEVKKIIYSPTQDIFPSFRDIKSEIDYMAAKNKVIEVLKKSPDIKKIVPDIKWKENKFVQYYGEPPMYDYV